MAKAAAKTVDPAGPPWNIKDVSSWPGAFGAFKYSQSAVVLNVGTILLIILASFVASAIQEINPKALFATIGIIGSFILVIMQYVTYLAGAQQEKIDITEAFKRSFDATLILNVIGLYVIVGLSLIVGFLLFIIPGLIILPRLALSPFYLLDNRDMNCVDAYKASWEATKGHSWKVWGIIGVSFLMILPVITIIGILVTIYLLFMYAAATAVLYEYVKRRGPVEAAPAKA